MVKYADNILKAFATSCSLVGVSVISALFFDFPVTMFFAVGAIVVRRFRQQLFSQNFSVVNFPVDQLTSE